MPLIVTLPMTASLNSGVVVPIPTLPDEVTVKYCDPVEEATEKMLLVVPLCPCTTKLEFGVPEPIPRYLLVLSQKKLALFWAREVPLLKMTEPR